MAKTLRGRKQFFLKLKNLKPAVRLEIEAATARNAKDVAKTAKTFAPIDEGDLRASIRAESLAEGKAIRWRVIAGNEKVFYARFVEFGTAPSAKGQKVTNNSGRTRTAGRTHAGTAAQPYFFAAARSLRKRMRSRLSRAFTKAKRAAMA